MLAVLYFIRRRIRKRLYYALDVEKYHEERHSGEIENCAKCKRAIHIIENGKMIYQDATYDIKVFAMRKERLTIAGKYLLIINPHNPIPYDILTN